MMQRKVGKDQHIVQGGWSQGIYRVKNIHKYMSKTPPIFRSSWEHNVMYMFDTNDSIRMWGSEIIEIPYIHPLDGKYHRYFADFFVEFKNKEGEYKRWVIEVKPLSKLSPPKQQRRTKTQIYQMNDYMINMAKWDAARLFCSKRGWEFKIYTEVEIKGILT